jgi:hypothetical protein
MSIEQDDHYVAAVPGLELRKALACHKPGYFERARNRKRWLSVLGGVALSLAGAAVVAGVGPRWLTIPLGALAGVTLILGEWAWRKTQFCPACGARTKSPLEKKSGTWCDGCNRLNNPANLTLPHLPTLELINFDAAAWAMGPSADPIAKLLWEIVFISVYDDLTEIVFQTDSVLVRCADSYRAIDASADVCARLVRLLQFYAGVDPADSRPATARWELNEPCQRLPADVAFEPTDHGAQVVIRMPDNRHSERRAALAPELEAKFQAMKAAEDAALQAEIAARPPDLRLPHQGYRFRAIREMDVKLVILDAKDVKSLEAYEIHGDLCHVAKGEVLVLEYEPDPATTVCCHLKPQRYGRLERRFVPRKMRDFGPYRGYLLCVKYGQLAADFQWMIPAEKPAA